MKESSERVMLVMLSDILRSVTATVLDVTGETSIWQVDQTSGQFVETVASTEMQQSRTFERRYLR